MGGGLCGRVFCLPVLPSPGASSLFSWNPIHHRPAVRKVSKNDPLIQKVLHQRNYNGCPNACSQKMALSSDIDQDVLNIERATL